MKARDITECENCPLNDECNRGVVTGSGLFIEPPCCSWDDDTEVYEGMYD